MDNVQDVLFSRRGVYFYYNTKVCVTSLLRNVVLVWYVNFCSSFCLCFQSVWYSARFIGSWDNYRV